MKQNIATRRPTLLAILFIVGAVVLWKTFSLALFGDDWLEFYRFRYHVGEWSTGQYNLLTYFLTPYGAQETIMGGLAKIFGYNTPYPFYLLSFILRSLASATIFFITDKLTKNRWAAFWAGLFFIVTPIGLEATNWVFNMASYITISATALMAYFFIKSQLEGSYSHTLLAALFYYLAYLWGPIRIHGLPVLVIGLELFFVLQVLATKRLTTKEFRIIVFRQLLMAAMLGAILLTGAAGNIGPNLSARLKEGVGTMVQQATNNDYLFLFNPIAILGRFFVPEDILAQIQSMLGPLGTQSLIVASIFFAPFALLVTRLTKNKTGTHILVLLAAGCWVLLVKLALSTSLAYLDPTFMIPLYLGGVILIFWVYLVLTRLNQPVANFIFLSLAWALAGFMFPWLWTPTTLFGTQHRYLIMSAPGIALFLASLVIVAQKRERQIAWLITVLVVGLHAVSTYRTFDYLEKVRNQKLNDKIWSKLSRIDSIGKDNTPLLFYFESENSATLYYLVTFGFPPHVGILYDIKDLNKLPVPLDRWEDVVTAVTSGKNMPAYGYPPRPVPITNLYSYRVGANGDVTEITAQTRKALGPKQ